MSLEIDNLLNQIIQAIDLSLSPTTNNDDRFKANQFIVEIKSNLNKDFEKYLMLSFRLLNYTTESANSNQQNLYKFHSINHFGLQLMELMVKFNWNKLNANCKQELKLMVENVIFKKDLPITTLVNIYDNRFLKDQFSRLLVEILMREWPQNWPNFLTSCLSQPRNHLVLHTLWRLSEDIGLFFLPNNPQRRREMNNELTENLNCILKYIADCLVLDNSDLTILALETLCSFFEWCKLSADALTFLCKVLTIEMQDTYTLFKFCNSVADCFFTCLNRKSYKQEEKKILLVFFEEQNLSVLVNFLEKLIPFVQHKIENKVIDERTFDLVKRICNVFSLMGQTCISICNQYNIQFPLTWPIYLNVMLYMIEYNNQIYNYYALQFWKDLFKNQQIKDNCVSEEMLLKIINLLPYKMVKKDEMNNIFLVYEFDGIADYNVFFTRFRSEFCEFLRSLTKHNERLCFNLAISLVQQSLQCKQMNKNEWTTIGVILDSVCSNLTNVENYSEQALPVLKFMLSIIDTIDDPELISILLSSLTPLAVFMPYSKENIYKEYLTKIFSLVLKFSYLKEETQFGVRNRIIRDLRRHVCSVFIKLALRHSESLSPLFESIKEYVFQLDLNPAVELTQNERCALYEGLIILSNSFTETSKQTEFILQILKPVDWLITYNMSTIDFVKHVGLTSPQTEWESSSENRQSLIYTVSILSIIIKRVTRKIVLLPEFLPYISSLTKLIRNLNEMWSPELQQICYPDYRNTIFSPILESDRQILLEGFIPSSKQSKVEDSSESYNANRMQTFLWLLHENSYIAIGNASNLLNVEFYNSLHIVDLLSSIGYLPDFKFKMIFRSCFKQLITNCPKNEQIYEKKIMPLFHKFLPDFFEKLNLKWDTNKQFRDSNQNNDQLEAEILEEQICRFLSKEFIDFLNMLLIEKPVSTVDEDKLSDLGIFILKQLPNVIFMTATLMTWLDSTISLKATTLTIKIIDKLDDVEVLKQSNAIEYLINKLLIALGYFGEHEQNQALLLSLFVKVYENYIVRYNFNDIKSQLATYSGVNIRSWNNYNEKVMVNGTAKKKRDSMKNLLTNVIGKNLSQLFKQDKEEIRNLHPILSRTEKQKREDKLNSSFDEDNPELSETFWKFL